MSSALSRFVDLNVKTSDRLVPEIVQQTHAYRRYSDVGAELLKARPRTVLDVGAGKQWHFDPALKSPGMRLIGFDIDLDEMRPNTLLDERVGGDACVSLGVPDGSVDLIMGRAVIEHLHDTEAFVRNAYNALGSGGQLIVTFPNKYAPFALLNRALPRRVSQWLLANFVPGSAGKLGFEAFYNQTSYHQFRRCLVDAGFEVEEAYASYFSSWYFRFFVPLFLAGLAYDFLTHFLRNPRLASYLMFVAKKV